jgi:hypothetical protein
MFTQGEHIFTHFTVEIFLDVTSPLSMTTKGQWLQMNITSVALASADAHARLMLLPVSGSGSCTNGGANDEAQCGSIVGYYDISQQLAAPVWPWLQQTLMPR